MIFLLLWNRDDDGGWFFWRQWCSMAAKRIVQLTGVLSVWVLTPLHPNHPHKICGLRIQITKDLPNCHRFWVENYLSGCQLQTCFCTERGDIWLSNSSRSIFPLSSGNSTKSVKPKNWVLRVAFIFSLDKMFEFIYSAQWKPSWLPWPWHPLKLQDLLQPPGVGGLHEEDDNEGKAVEDETPAVKLELEPSWHLEQLRKRSWVKSEETSLQAR